MSNVLTKSYLAGIPGSPGTPPNNGTPGTPSYTSVTYVEEPQYTAGGGWVGPDENGNFWFIPDGTLILTGYVLVPQYTFHNGTAGTPPSPGTPATLPQPGQYNIGWNSSANSLGTLSVPGEFQFSVDPSATGVFAGLGASPAGNSYVGIQYGLYLATGIAHVAELGVLKTGGYAFVPTDVFTIAVQGAVVQYYQNSTLIYTSTVANSYTSLYATADLYTGADAVNNALFGAIESKYSAVTGNVTVGLLTGVNGTSIAGGASLTTGWEDYGSIPSLIATANSYNYGAVSVGLLTKLTGQSHDSTFREDCIGLLAGITAYDCSANLLTPSFAIVYQGTLNGIIGGGLAGFGAGTVNGILTGVGGNSIAGGASLTAGWEDYGSLVTLNALANQTFPLPNGFIGTIWGGLNVPTYSLFAYGQDEVGDAPGFEGTILTSYSINEYGGAYARLAVSHCTLVASGTVTTLGEAYLTAPVALPHYPILATGTFALIGRAYLGLAGDYEVSGFGGGTAQLIGPSDTVITAHGFGGQLGEVVESLSRHHYVVAASGSIPAYGNCIGILATLTTVPVGQVAANADHYSLIAYGHDVVTAAYEAYSCTLLGEKDDIDHVAVTHYTNYPFIRIVRFGAKYYGVGTDGVYELSGNTFNGTAITSVVETGETDMGEPTMKRTRRLYIAGRLSQDLQVSVIAHETDTETFTYDPVLGGARNTRVALGRGIQARYLAFQFQNLDGQDFVIEELGPETDQLRRTA